MFSSGKSLVLLICHAGITLAALLAALPLTTHAHGDLHRRIERATAAISNEPTNARLYLIRGELHREHRDIGAAIADYERAEKLDTNLTQVDFCRAKLLMDFGELPAARVKFDDYLSRVPSDGQALIERARLLSRMSERKAAIADFTRGIALQHEPQPDVFLERAQVQVADGQSEAALRGLDEGIKLLGPLVTLQLRAIDLEVSRTNYNAALTRLDSIINQSARKENWLARRGDILLQAGKTNDARVSYELALAAAQSLPQRLQEGEPVIALSERLTRTLRGLTNSPAGGKTATVPFH